MTEKHVHKLKRVVHKSGNAIFFCVLDCKFKISVVLALGKRTVCWRCGNEFNMNDYSLRLAKPHCDSCHKPKGGLIKEGEAPGLVEFIPEPNTPIPANLSLSERLQQTINNAQKDEGDI